MVSRPLLSAAIRPLAVALLAICVAVTALLAAWVMHQTRAGWLDAAVDGRVQASLGGHRALLNRLAALGDPVPLISMTAPPLLACLATRRWRGALLVAVAVPAAGALSELALKPLIGRRLLGELSFPSGHATGVFALAVAVAVLLAGPQRPPLPAAVRLLLAITAFSAAGAVAAALVGLRFHYFTDTVGGAAVGTAVVLATALILDRLPDRLRRSGKWQGRHPAAAGTSATRATLAWHTVPGNTPGRTDAAGPAHGESGAASP